MQDTLVALLAAHFTADFLLQPDWMVRDKRRPAILGLHILVVILTAGLLLGGGAGTMLYLLFVTHLLMDAVKIFVLPDSLMSFLIDQGFHLFVIVVLAMGFPQTFAQGWWPAVLAGHVPAYLAWLCVLSGVIVNLRVGDIVIGKLTAPLSKQFEDISGLPKGSHYIGLLERGIIMLLIFANMASGAGFLMTAKSILRFGDVREPAQRKSAEYIIIGTFLSFGWGLATALLSQWGFAHFSMAG